MVRVLTLEKGDAGKILDWFKMHKDEEYADILERIVKESREKLNLR